MERWRAAREAQGRGDGAARRRFSAGSYPRHLGVVSRRWRALAQWLLVRSGVISEMGLAIGDRRIAGILLIAAGLYQATPVKRACLESCRSPLSFLMRLWRPGWAGAARLGFAHGLYCLGCCALLMTLLFVFGVMNLVWVAALALFVLVEKLLPVGPRFSAGVGIAAVIIGFGMIIGDRLSGAA